MSTYLEPLNNLLRHGKKFTWNKECEDAFVKIKAEITSERILAHYDPSEALVLATDASPTGLGACLSHRYKDGSEKPIAFASRTLTKSERKYSQIDKEAVGIYWGLKKFFAYCYGRKFVLITDHKPLVSIFDPAKTLPSMTASRMFNYAHFLSGFDYTIEYRNTTEHANADFLSRFPVTEVPENVFDDHEQYLMNQVEAMPVTRIKIEEETRKDENLKVISHYLNTGKSLKELGLNANEFCLMDGCVFRGNRICVPLTLRKQVLNELHAGHMGMTKMKLLARSYCYWQNIDQEIENLVKHCYSCQQKLKSPPKETVHPWEPPSGPWERIHVDFAGPIKGWSYFIVVDAYSKWVEVIPTKSTTTDWCLKQLDNLFATFGYPHVLVSDNGTQLTSTLFENYLKKYKIIHKTIAPFCPKSNGQVERSVQTVKNLLHACGGGHNEDKINTILKQLRKTHHSATGQSPYLLMFGRNVRTEMDLMVERTPTPQMKRQVLTRRSFSKGQIVLMRNYSNMSEEIWSRGIVERPLGNVMYLVQSEDGRLFKRHCDQLRAA
ncbi:uncharacterized protein K02A2.6-like [Macrosteles quadrilineatus]|uniref:uncharacterized protein K02A2.6-like n=1 Tax=Macrosteles quadrilineatus TaxID=74068 RepID=UPI0023E27672|nr:uncharacterized protein K02A2.6-like [Macrosteles quadrilineatus]